MEALNVAVATLVAMAKRPGSSDSANDGAGNDPTDADMTSPTSDDFLAENRANRAKARDEAAAKEAKAQAKLAKRDKTTGADTEDDRRPRKIDSRPKTSRVRSSRVVTGLLVGLCVAVIALAALAGFFGYRYYETRDELAAQSASSQYGKDAMDTARRYAATIGTYDPDNYADLDRRIRGISTPSFADSYITSSQDARKGNTNARGASKAESKYAGLESLSATKAVVLVTLDQVVKVPDLQSAEPNGIPYQSRVKITLKRDGDRWLISDLETV
ncbi:hypothetical protein GOEFS_077_00490 [Gordonia effusa NBRC 100432]|uniref:Mce-associated membrane protein n=1 Tax=Gordonia effusa NBRC 100432 TaxID=1077974 RepID=H0R2F6_9ACTN|nr:hypothetical protein GOEFS_077_00490 [Gordonia effusa NBRC 100432]